MMYCKHCGSPVNDDQVICTNCGCETGLGQTPPTQEKNNPAYLNGKDKIVMALLAFFLGGWGIHNFILGETKKGIIRIVFNVVSCGLVSSILALIDFILILTDKYVVDPNKYFI